MIEVLFGESEAASMKAAKSSKVLEKRRGPAAVIGNPANVENEDTVKWIQGNAEEVICLGMMLDIGDINEAVDSDYRKELIYNMYAQEQWGKDSEMDAELKNLGNVYAKELLRLKTYLEKGESIRIWYSDSPYSCCGFYYLCKWLKPFHNAIWVVKLTEYRCKGKRIVSYQNWGEVAAEEFAAFLQYERKLSDEELNRYALLWSELVEENAPLRAVINGRVVGVNEDFYDFLIWKKLTKKPVKQARLIGDILGHYPISVGDWWYAKRIEHFISQGMIKVVTDSENKYARTIVLA